MSFSKNDKETIGEIEGGQVSVKTGLTITEASPQHYIVAAEERISEVFITKSGLFSDGNALDSIEVSIQSERKRLIKENFKQNKETGDLSGTKGMVLKAPMPGMVRSISVIIGDEVQKNTQVLVLEAMKMENSITAGYAGVVTKIHVQAGTSVEKNIPLLEFSRKE